MVALGSLPPHPMMMSVSIGGISHIGADVGGFFGNPDEQLLARWYQVGYQGRFTTYCDTVGWCILSVLPCPRSSRRASSGAVVVLPGDDQCDSIGDST